MAESRNSIENIWGDRTPYVGEGRWPERRDERTAEKPDRWVQSACVLCSNGCGCDIGVKDGRIVGVRGRPQDITSRGRLGPKGLHGWEANNSPDRLTTPLIRGSNGNLEPASWDEAMELIVTRAKRTRDEHTASSIGFYTSGQLFLEEYYTLGVIGKAGLGTPHMDGNTRLCTATAAAALKESFGADGQPGSYWDIDETVCIFMVGHNMSSTDTVLWSRVLDRRGGPNPPKLIVVDPRETMTAKQADLHLRPKLGTNVALLNGLLNLVLEEGYFDGAFIDNHTLGAAKLEKMVSKYPPERVEEITGVPAADLRRAASMIGKSQGLLSTCLQGVYQSNQATAAAVQVNNLNLLLGRIGRPGCGILQMNGQPTSQNTRECGADGDLPAFRNWENDEHIRELAELWNVEPGIIPHWAPPTHAMQIFRYCETGSIRFLWIQATNPAVSLPNLDRVRSTLRRPGLFLVVQDGFMTETAEFADVVLPAAIWGEKTGTFTNVDRTVHISYKAVEPPGQARSDFDIFLDFARRMDFRDKDGQALIKWGTPEECFEAWQDCTRGRPCDYTGLSYAKLTGGSGIQWPCNEEAPQGSRRIYTDLVFPTGEDDCESFGHDLLTGAPVQPVKYKAQRPDGRAWLKAAEYLPPAEQPDENYPFFLTTGRLVFHFHTRTKTGRSPELNAAAPDENVEVCSEEAAKLGVSEGDWLRMTSRRGVLDAQVRIGKVSQGELFLPFHFGYWDSPGHARAANELTLFEWDPVSKQPHYKYAAVAVEKIASPQDRQPEQVHVHPTDPDAGESGTTLKEAAKHLVDSVKLLAPERAHVRDYVSLLQLSEERLATALEQVRDSHRLEPDIVTTCQQFETWSATSAERLRPFVKKYGKRREGEPERLDKALLKRRSSSGFNLVRDLHDLWLLVNESLISVDILEQAGHALRDHELLDVLAHVRESNQRQGDWLRSRLRQAAPQVLVVPS